MPKKSFKIIPDPKAPQELEYAKFQYKDLILETAGIGDIEELRVWKNENRQYFFNKNIISAKDQEKWFDDFLITEDDYIFMIKYGDLNIGCIGFRLLSGVVDVYNVILGNRQYLSQGIMSFALTLMCSFILDNYKNDITVRVLIDNPARKWYEKNNFLEICEKEDHVFLKLKTGKFKYLKYNVKKN